MKEPLFTDAEIRDLLSRDEGQFLEFKSLWDKTTATPSPLDRRQARDHIAEAIAAFANADGGTLLIGVDDDGTPSGHGYPEDALQHLLLVGEQRLEPSVRCRVQRTVIDGHEIIAFEVPMTPEAVMMRGNGFPYRAGDQVIKETQERINERKQSYRRVGFEQRRQPDATLEDLDLALAARFPKASVFQDRAVDARLTRYGLIAGARESLSITNAALLLYAHPPVSRWHPRAGLRIFRVEGTERAHGPRRNVTQVARIDAPLAEAVEQAYRTMREQIRRSEKLHALFFREMPEYPEFAWQEALINAVAHRDYEDRSREIEVWLFEDRLEIRSPGGPIAPVTLEALRERRPVHASRNPLLVRVLADAGLMREEGEGIPRMFEEMEESLLPGPEFEVVDGWFTVRLRNEPVFSGPDADWMLVVRRLPLSVRQRRVLVAHPRGFSNEDYRRLANVDRDQAYREIQELVALGVVTPAKGYGRGAVYGIAPDLLAEQVFLAKRLPEVRVLLAHRGSFKNAEYRERLHLTRFEALRELRRLVEGGVLRLEGERRGSRYVPGPVLGLHEQK